MPRGATLVAKKTMDHHLHNTSGSLGQLSTGGGSANSTGARMHHSHSTPAGVDGGGSRTPPTTPKKGGKMLAVRVQMLDDTITMFQVQVGTLLPYKCLNHDIVASCSCDFFPRILRVGSQRVLTISIIYVVCKCPPSIYVSSPGSEH